MNKNNKILVTGATGMVGSSIVSRLNENGYYNILRPRRDELDYTNQLQVKEYFFNHRPEYVFLAAAKVGGILVNNHKRAEFIYENIVIQSNIIHNSYLVGTKKLIFLGSSCIYPKECLQPIKEDYLLSGPLEKTNEPYAVAKIAGIKMCDSYNKQYGCNFVTVMPSNLYGLNDNFNLETGHVLPSLLHKVHLAKKNNLKHVEVWGTGKPRREFLNVTDLSDACILLMKKNNLKYDCYNVGTGFDVTIEELTKIIFEVVGYEGKFIFNSKMPDGTFQKLLHIDRITAMGWKANIELKQGIQEVYQNNFLTS